MKNWFDIIEKEENLHKKFKHLLDIFYTNERELLEDWITRFIIKDGETKTIKQFQSSYHSMAWEVYLNELIISSGGTIDNKVSSPDFFIHKDGKNASIEAVVANISPKYGIPETERTISDIYGENDYSSILNESIIRLLSAITYKSDKYYKTYNNNEKVNNRPYVIALSDHAQINSGQSSCFPLLAILFNAYYDPDDKENLKILGYDNFDREYKYKEHHIKANGEPLELGLFSTEKYKHISAIIYSCTMTLGKLTSLSKDHFSPKFIIIEREEFKKIRYSDSSPDETLSDGIFIFHNPYAERPFSEHFINGDGVTNIYLDKDDDDEMIKIKTIGDYSPLIRRFVGMRGDEYLYVDDIDQYTFYDAKKVDFFGVK
jgi:hypothetical protein